MKQLTFAVIAVATLAACGGGVDDHFAGVWSGTASFTSPGIPAQTTQVTFVLDTDDGVLVVPSCNGRSLRVPGEGRRAFWTGQEVCPLPTASCPTATVTTLEYEAVLVSDDSIRTRGVNRVDGCGASAQVLGSFDGVRQ